MIDPLKIQETGSATEEELRQIVGGQQSTVPDWTPWTGYKTQDIGGYRYRPIFEAAPSGSLSPLSGLIRYTPGTGTRTYEYVDPQTGSLLGKSGQFFGDAPSDFNWQQYLSNYADLSAAGIDTPYEAELHYLMHGAPESRTYTASTGWGGWGATDLAPRNVSGVVYEPMAGDKGWVTSIRRYAEGQNAPGGKYEILDPSTGLVIGEGSFETSSAMSPAASANSTEALEIAAGRKAFNPIYDINNDGTVNAADARLLAKGSPLVSKPTLNASNAATLDEAAKQAQNKAYEYFTWGKNLPIGARISRLPFF